MGVFKQFAKAEKGSTAVTFAIAVIPLMVAAGTAIDFARFYTGQTQLQTALDDGTLAAALARDKTVAQRKKIGTDAFNANMKTGEVSMAVSTINFDVNNTSVVATASLTMPTSFLGAIGITSMDLGVSSEVAIPENKNAEIAFVLDYSGSMGDVSGAEVKYVAMQKAATKLIDDLTKDNADKVKFALVPFSHQVYTSLPNSEVLGQPATGTWTGCTQDRQYPYNLTDATPSSAAGSKWGQPTAPDHAYYGCSGYKDHHLKLQPLTNDFAGLKNQLGVMTPYAYTHVALGVEFGYQVLSPNAPFSEGVSYANKKTQKYMIVLTDGEQTEPAFGPSGTRSVDQGNSNLEALCTNAKASGITMLTLAFDLDDSSQRQRLQNCATDPTENFFVANNSNEMAVAFQTITKAISSQAFLSK
jgi:Flp pilus assembly protein TadG